MYEKEKEITDKIDVKEAIKMFQNLIFAENYKIAENHCRKLAIEALEKQIPKKPDKIKEYNPNDYYCTVCKYYLGYACLQPKFCPNCGQAIDRSVKE